MISRSIIGKQAYWRTAGLVLLLVALLGPWNYELINVPAAHTCLSPLVRLNQDFCGTPTSLARSFFDILEAIIQYSSEFLAGSSNLSGIRFFLVVFVFGLPLLTGMILLLWGNHPLRQIPHMLALGLANAGGLFLGLQVFLTLTELAGATTDQLTSLQVYGPPLLSLWGIWLYIAVTDLLLMGEVILLLAGTRPMAVDG